MAATTAATTIPVKIGAAHLAEARARPLAVPELTSWHGGTDGPRMGTAYHDARVQPLITRPPVFIVGAPRSGTSLAYRALCMHPEAAWISNWVRRLPAWPEVAFVNRLARWSPQLRRRAWFVEGTNAYVYGSRLPLWKRLYPNPVEGEPLYRRCGIGEGGDERSRAQLHELRVAVAALCRASGGGVFVNKRIANNRRIPLLDAAFPESKFIELVRDGRAVALSLSRVEWWPSARLWWWEGTPSAWERDGGDPWELCARAWVEEVRAVTEGLATVDASRVLRVRYEELVADPNAVLGMMAVFAGLSPNSTWRHELLALSFPNRNETWRRQLAPDARRTIERVQRGLLTSLGYC